MYFLNRGDTDTYITIHKEDEQNFYDIINSGIFTKENKFRLIKDKAEMKKDMQAETEEKIILPVYLLQH